ncbi:Flp family type IVb pilin [Nocardioides marmoraquaticus]
MLEYLRSLLPSVRRTEDGASAVEYGLLVAGIAALVVAVVFLLGGVVKGSFTETCSTISGDGTATAATTAACD